MTTVRHDVWYLEAETVIGGERRGFSWQILARPDRSRTIPQTVQTACGAHLASVVDISDVHNYSAVDRGERCDFPYRHASYTLKCNGVDIVGSAAIRPVKPDVMV